jgi:rare lipoprotein A
LNPHRPDRVAAWAVALGLLTILLAGATSRAATTGGTAVPGTGGAPPGAPAPDAAASDPAQRELQARIASLPTEIATWYGPGFFGRRTACGRILRRSTQGVAHRRLPCGTPVTFYYRGRLKTVPVIDRGPYTRRVSWDLTAATARDLGVRRTSRVRALRH